MTTSNTIQMLSIYATLNDPLTDSVLMGEIQRNINSANYEPFHMPMPHDTVYEDEFSIFIDDINGHSERFIAEIFNKYLGKVHYVSLFGNHARVDLHGLYYDNTNALYCIAQLNSGNDVSIQIEEDHNYPNITSPYNADDIWVISKN